MTITRINPQYQAKGDYATYASGQNASISNFSGANQVFGIVANCVNANNASKYGKRYSLIIHDTNLALYCNTDDSWSLRVPWSRSGSNNVPVKSGAVGTTTKYISFGTTFPSAPNVVVTPRANYSDGGVWLSQALKLSVTDVTTTGFTVVCTCNSASASTSLSALSFYWMAML